MNKLMAQRPIMTIIGSSKMCERTGSELPKGEVRYIIQHTVNNKKMIDSMIRDPSEVSFRLRHNNMPQIRQIIGKMKLMTINNPASINLQLYI